jgi:hypothetical protein
MGRTGNDGAFRCSSALGMETVTTNAKKNQVGTSIAMATAVATGVSAENSPSRQRIITNDRA